MQRDCSDAALGKPTISDELFATAASQINPITTAFGGLVPGAELFARVSTKNADGDLFDKSSWTILVSAPLFLAGADAPSGLRAGFAPELTIPTKDGEKTDLALLLFVGTTFRALSQ